MKRKSKLAPRNPLVATSKFRKAGPHDKAFKAKRRADKVETQRVGSSRVEQGAFNLQARFDPLPAHHSRKFKRMPP